MANIGVYLCTCGTNISDNLDIAALEKNSGSLKGVKYVTVHRLLCSEDGKKFLADDLKSNKPSHIVIAACSPKEHELTFRKVCMQSVLNPYMMQMVNIREQVAWATADKNQATAKAGKYVGAAVQRVMLHEVLEKKEIACNTDAVVIGAGSAGMEAALKLASAGRKVYLVEKSPAIGGRVVRYEEVFPKMECAACMLEPKMDEVLHNENIELYTYSDINDIVGFLGNFNVKIKRKARSVSLEKCIGCGVCYEPCPVKVKNDYDYGLSERKAIYVPYLGALPNVPVIDRENCLRFKGQECDLCQKACAFGAIDYEEKDQVMERDAGAIILAMGFEMFDPTKIPELGYGRAKDVYTSLEFERLMAQSGPTGGKIVKKNGQPPKSVAIVHCVGSRDKKFNEYCSGVCCLYALKFTHLIEKQMPDAKIHAIYADWCLPGKDNQAFFNGINDKGHVNFIRTALPVIPKVEQSGDGLTLSFKDSSGSAKQINADMVVLCSAITPPRDTSRMAEMLSLSCGTDGFLIESHTKLAPVSTAIEGIYMAGCIQGPKDIPASITQGLGAAGLILANLVTGRKLELEVITAETNEKLCGGCKICIEMCPYKAIRWDADKKITVVNEILCKGCGTCVATCPSGASKGKHFTTKQIFAEIEEVLR